jgi:maltose phosphorylase
LNIGPKGFTGEKYGGSTYWTEVLYPFIWLQKTKSCSKFIDVPLQPVDKAIENAQNNLGFKNGAALYPMVTMNGEECHNGKSHMKKSIETAIALHILTIILPVITLYS